jgi:hypothetical protein
MKPCHDCLYLQRERAAIHHFDGQMQWWQAEEMAKAERCAEHQRPVQSDLAALLLAAVDDPAYAAPR